MTFSMARLNGATFHFDIKAKRRDPENNYRILSESENFYCFFRKRGGCDPTFETRVETARPFTPRQTWRDHKKVPCDFCIRGGQDATF